MMIPQQFFVRAAAVAATVALVAIGVSLQAQEKPKRPKVSLRSSPIMAFTPAMITFTAELRDGDDDYEEYYCASVEWDWGDGTRSESSDDCEPYEAGKSEIRRPSHQHKLHIDCAYDVQFREQRGKVVARRALRSPSGG